MTRRRVFRDMVRTMVCDIIEGVETSLLQALDSLFHRLTIFKSATIFTEHKYVIRDSSSEFSSDSDTLDYFGMEVEQRTGEPDSQISSER